MQMLSIEELDGYTSEFEAAKAAQNGNGKAWMLLWKHYLPLIMSRIRHARGYSADELRSEAAHLFAHKLELFDSSKVKSPESYSMFSWLYLGAINLNSKLIRHRKREIHLYNERVSSFHAGGGGGGDDAD